LTVAGRAGARVSVTIPTYGRPDTLCDVVRDVWNGRRRPDEIVVVCQGDDALATADRLRREVPEAAAVLRFYASTRRGTNANRNDAVRVATGEFIAFTDDDMRLPDTWLSAMLTAWETDWDGGPVLLTGPIHGPDDAAALSAVPGRRVGDERRIWRTPPPIGDVLFGEQFGAPRAVFERAGSPPFDERFGPNSPFPGAGDEEFAMRVLKAGVPIVFDPSIQGTHLAYPETWIRSLWTHAQGVGAMYALRWSEGERAVLGIALRNVFGIIAKGLRIAASLRFREAAGRFANAAGIVGGAVRWTASDVKDAPREGQAEPGALTLVPLD
jgi:glycosyltransferase involved in cell wall biosynthesis